jgi:hypothetical protein
VVGDSFETPSEILAGIGFVAVLWWVYRWAEGLLQARNTSVLR